MPRQRKPHEKMTIRSTGPIPFTSKSSPSLLGAISMTEPFRERMAQHIRDAYGIQDLSPTFINSVIASLPEYVPDDSPKSQVSHASKFSYKSTDWPEASPTSGFSTSSSEASPIGKAARPDSGNAFPLPRVERIQHIPRVNDRMHCALADNMRGPEEPYNDSLDCWNIRSQQFQHMKWRIIGMQEILEMPNLFHDPDVGQAYLPEDIFTTNEGLRRAIEDLDIYFGQGYAHDQMLIIAIGKRAGGFEARWNYRKKKPVTVYYPEEMIPYDLSRDGIYPDADYWHELRAQGEEFWRENEPLL